jgi:hypothetical protein
MDTARVTTFGQVVQVPFISKRFALKRFLGLTAEEVAENETQWREENIDEDTMLPSSAELRSVGVTANGMNADLSSIGGATTPPTPPADGAMPADGAAPAETPPPAA